MCQANIELSEKVAGGTFLNRNLTLFIRLVATLSKLMKLISLLPGLTVKVTRTHKSPYTVYTTIFLNLVLEN